MRGLGLESITTRHVNRYLKVLKTNREYRKLWSAQVVSQLGDWFSSISLYTLLLTLTGSAEAVGIFLSVQFLPAALAGYWTGPLVDRFSRKKLMFMMDILRAILALGYLLVDNKEEVIWVYIITFLIVICQAIFEPSRKAILPDIVSREEMVTANAISGATWSTMLALGAAIGGIVSDLFGRETAFVLNSLSFLLSAWFVTRLRAEEHSVEAKKKQPWSEGLSYLAAHPRVAVLAMSKTLWCLGGGITLVLTLFGSQLFPLGKDGAFSIGLFYMMRGLGAACGPFIAYAIGGRELKALTRALPFAFMTGAIGYWLLGQAEFLGFALFFVFLAHLGGATQWIFSTSLLQLSLPKHVRGRVFSLEYTGLNLATAASCYLVGYLGDQDWSPEELAQLMAGTYLLAGLNMGLLLKFTSPEQRPTTRP